ncbi:hypothetical protein DSL64_05050 [Dyadobacter luteus]|uniref:Exo-alpha-sialidase n=1 Tax=Dyadobacter luteus TaxID=2259619 RepID=A0A3D8YGM1_9BACT|nr:hypothetical protein [Dyadobacter luteus]REA63793.1 hypothetical protein DSL64_05050 [Dyadobacter luteus]
MKIFLYFFFILIALSCKKSDVDVVVKDTVLDEYPDWHTLKAPIDHTISGVWGNYNKTVLISTMFKLFRTTDQGRHWEQVHQRSIGMIGVVQYRDTLFTMTGLTTGINNNIHQEVIIHAGDYSIDDGKTWEIYKGRNPILRDHPRYDSPDKFLINPIIAPNKVTYQINRAFLDGPNAENGTFETPGVVKSTGERINLPQLHQLRSLYLDDELRLYIVGSDAVCGSAESFKFCNSKFGRGVVYVSKKPVP